MAVVIRHFRLELSPRNRIHPWLLNGFGARHLIDPWWLEARVAAPIILNCRAGSQLGS